MKAPLNLETGAQEGLLKYPINRGGLWMTLSSLQHCSGTKLMTGKEGNLLKKGCGDEPTDLHGHFRLSSFEVPFFSLFKTTVPIQAASFATHHWWCEHHCCFAVLELDWQTWYYIISGTCSFRCFMSFLLPSLPPCLSPPLLCSIISRSFSVRY